MSGHRWVKGRQPKPLASLSTPGLAARVEELRQVWLASKGDQCAPAHAALQRAEAVYKARFEAEASLRALGRAPERDSRRGASLVGVNAVRAAEGKVRRLVTSLQQVLRAHIVTLDGNTLLDALPAGTHAQALKAMLAPLAVALRDSSADILQALEDRAALNIEHAPPQGDSTATPSPEEDPSVPPPPEPDMDDYFDSIEPPPTPNTHT